MRREDDPRQRDKPMYRLDNYLIGEGAYGNVITGCRATEPEVKYAFKLLKRTDQSGIIGRAHIREFNALTFLRAAFLNRPIHGEAASWGVLDFPDSVYTDFPFLPLIKIVNGSSFYPPSDRKVQDILTNYIAFVFPAYLNDMSSYIKSGAVGSYTFAQLCTAMYKTIRAVALLHALGWSHRDLKLQNVLLSKDGMLILCDFGMARNERAPFAVNRYIIQAPREIDTAADLRAVLQRSAINRRFDVYSYMHPFKMNSAGMALRQVLDDQFDNDYREEGPKYLAGCTSLYATLWWRSPEQLLGFGKHFSGILSDSWSLGAMLLELIFEFPIFKTFLSDDEEGGSGEVIGHVNYLSPLALCKLFDSPMRHRTDTLTSDTVECFENCMKQMCPRADYTAILKLLDRMPTRPPPSTEAAPDQQPVRTESDCSADLDAMTSFFDNLSSRDSAILKSFMRVNGYHAVDSFNPKTEIARIYSDMHLFSTSRFTMMQAIFKCLVLRFSSDTGIARYGAWLRSRLVEALTVKKDCADSNDSGSHPVRQTSSQRTGFSVPSDAESLLELFGVKTMVDDFKVIAREIAGLLHIDPEKRALPSSVLGNPVLARYANANPEPIDHEARQFFRSLRDSKAKPSSSYKFFEKVLPLLPYSYREGFSPQKPNLSFGRAINVIDLGALDDYISSLE